MPGIAGLAAVFLAMKVKGNAGIFGCEASLFSFRAQLLVRRSGHRANLIARQDFRGIRKIASSGGPCFTEGCSNLAGLWFFRRSR